MGPCLEIISSLFLCSDVNGHYVIVDVLAIPPIHGLYAWSITAISIAHTGGSITKHVDMSLYAFPSFHVREPYKSAVPAVAFTLGLHSKHNKPLDVSFMFNLPLGQQEDTIRVGDNFGEVVFTRFVSFLFYLFVS